MISVLQRIVSCILQEQLRPLHICTDTMGLGLIGGVACAVPGVKLHYNQEHVRARPGSQSWSEKIKNNANRRLIENDVSILSTCRGDIHHRNAFRLALVRWGPSGYGEVELAAMVYENYFREGDRYANGAWNCDSIAQCGYLPWTQSLDRYHLFLKGCRVLQRMGVIRFDVSLRTFLDSDISKLCLFDASIIANAPIGVPPLFVVNGQLALPYSTKLWPP
jgi:hypothetical protein